MDQKPDRQAEYHGSDGLSVSADILYSCHGHLGRFTAAWHTASLAEESVADQFHCVHTAVCDHSGDHKQCACEICVIIKSIRGRI